MKKREVIRKLKENFDVNIKYFGVYDFSFVKGSKTYHVKVLNVSSSHQITINSRSIWELKRGRIRGIKFDTIDSKLESLEEYNRLNNKIIFLTEKPFKILKVLNESDLEDISDEKLIFDTFVTHKLSELISHI